MKHFLKELLKKYGHIWILGYGFIYLPWFMHLEKTVTSNYHIMHSSLDDMIPFNEYFVIPYLLWFAYVTAAFGRNIFWADGSYTNIFGKTKAGKPAGAPEEAHAKAIANLEARRAAGKAPKINA